MEDGEKLGKMLLRSISSFVLLMNPSPGSVVPKKKEETREMMVRRREKRVRRERE